MKRIELDSPKNNSTLQEQLDRIEVKYKGIGYMAECGIIDRKAFLKGKKHKFNCDMRFIHSYNCPL